MNVEIDRLAVTLSGTSATLGRAVSEQLVTTLRTVLARELELGRLRTTVLDRLDLGAIDAPANSDAATIARLIATRLVHWVNSQSTKGPSGDLPPETR